MSVTIQEVAEAAGVSKATVSKVLHKSYSISQETCDRVNAVIKELGYQPNRRAQSFATGATKTILFLAEMQHGVGFDNPHLFEIMAGVENALSEKGYGLIVQHSTALDLWQHFDELLQRGFVLATEQVVDAEVVAGFQVVAIGLHARGQRVGGGRTGQRIAEIQPRAGADGAVVAPGASDVPAAFGRITSTRRLRCRPASSSLP